MAKPFALILLWPVWAAAGYVFLWFICGSEAAFPWRSVWFFHAGWSLLFLLSLRVMMRIKPQHVGFLFLGWSMVKIIASGAFVLWARYREPSSPLRFLAGFMVLYLWFTVYEWMLNFRALKE